MFIKKTEKKQGTKWLAVPVFFAEGNHYYGIGTVKQMCVE